MPQHLVAIRCKDSAGHVCYEVYTMTYTAQLGKLYPQRRITRVTKGKPSDDLHNCVATFTYASHTL